MFKKNREVENHNKKSLRFLLPKDNICWHLLHFIYVYLCLFTFIYLFILKLFYETEVMLYILLFI